MTKQERRDHVFACFFDNRNDPDFARSRACFVLMRARSQRERDELEVLVESLYEKALARIKEERDQMECNCAPCERCDRLTCTDSR